MNAKSTANARARLDELREEKVSRINDLLEEIQDNLKRWITKPLDANFVSTISGLKQCGVKLNGTELDALKSSVKDSYLGMKLLSSLADDNGIYLETTDAEHYAKMLNSIKASAELFLNYYCGEQAQGMSLMDSNINTNLVYAACDPYVLRSSSPLLVASLLWDGSGIPQTKKDSLTTEEKDIVRDMFSGVAANNYEGLKARAAEIITENPDMEDIISLHPDYKNYLPEEEDVHIEE